MLLIRQARTPSTATWHAPRGFKSHSERRASSCPLAAVRPTASYHARLSGFVVGSSPWWPPGGMVLAGRDRRLLLGGRAWCQAGPGGRRDAPRGSWSRLSSRLRELRRGFDRGSAAHHGALVLLEICGGVVPGRTRSASRRALPVGRAPIFPGEEGTACLWSTSPPAARLPRRHRTPWPSPPRAGSPEAVARHGAVIDERAQLAVERPAPTPARSLPRV